MGQLRKVCIAALAIGVAVAITAPAADAAPKRTTVSFTGPTAVTTVEGNSDHVVTLPVALSQPVKKAVVVAVTAVVSGGGNTDYSVPGAITFAKKQTNATLAVTIRGDRLVELNATLTLKLVPPKNIGLGAAPSATVTIVDDDVSVPPAPLAPALLYCANTRMLRTEFTAAPLTTYSVVFKHGVTGRTLTYGVSNATAVASRIRVEWGPFPIESEYGMWRVTVTAASGTPSVTVNHAVYTPTCAA